MKRSLLRVLQASGLFAFSRRVSLGRARILMYHNFCGSRQDEAHHVDLASARNQLAHLRRHFSVVPLTELINRLRSGCKFEHPTAALTIDDGRQNCYQFFYPLLKEFQMPATLFVVTSFIQGENWIWTDKVLWLSEQTGRPAELSSDSIEALFRILNPLHPKDRDAHIDSIAAAMNVSIPKNAPAKYAPCSWAQLREMADSGLIDIGSHSVTHPIFTTLTEEECRYELTTSRAQIEREVYRQVACFCFPNGKPEDYRTSQLEEVRKAGYTGAVVTSFGMVDRQSDPFELPRIGIGGDSDFLSFSKYVDGVEHYQHAFLARLRNRKV